MIEVPVSVGEIVDKITILEIKMERMSEADKRANVGRELALLVERLGPLTREISALKTLLKGINERLWVIEDEIRDCEREKDFGPRFIELARAVYITNDKRAETKRVINLALSSTLVEEKSYKAYG
jgi:hypothetical protein